MSPLYPPPSPPPPTPRVIIIGAGVSGLSCAHHLHRASQPFDVVLLEARSRPGGRVLTHWLSPSDPSAPSSHTAQVNQHVWPSINSDGTLVQQQQHALPFEELQKKPKRHAFAQLAAGTAIPVRTSADGTPRLSVDIGASIMHGCGDENQLVFDRAIQERIRAPVVAGACFYESTEHALWYDDNTGMRISTTKIVEMHNYFFMASRYMAAVASQSDDGAADMQTMFDCALQYVTSQLPNVQLSHTDRAILRKICARSVGYCSPMADMALMQASAGMEITSADALIGVPYEEDDPPFPGEIPALSPNSLRAQAMRLQRSVIASQRIPSNLQASRKGGPGDRIVLDGYTPFLVDKLREGVDIRFNQSVCAVTKAIKPVHPSFVMRQQQSQNVPAKKPSPKKRMRSPQQSAPSTKWCEDPEAASRTVLVSTRSGDVYQGDFVVVTVPLGVLQRDHEESSVSFTPPLSQDKQEAIKGMGMGVHNKIVLRFRNDDVFWPPKVPQLNCLDPRFQFFNLHAYGKTGMLLVHVFAESGFAKGYWGLTDEGVVAEVLLVLGGMFCVPSDVSAEGMMGANNIKQTTRDKPDPKNQAKTKARRKVAALLNVCENCRQPLEEAGAKGKSEVDMCKSCGFLVQKVGEKVPLKKVEQRSARLREKAEKYPPPTEGAMSNASQLDKEIVFPKRRVTWDQFPAPEEYIVTRWEDDPFALGSYSYMPCGSNWVMIDQVAAPEPPEAEHPYLFFAGEHCSDMGWQCVHGAHETGIRAAMDIISSVQGGETTELTEDVAKTEMPSPSKETLMHPFWTQEREKALTRALIGYSDVYGNYLDVLDEMAHALQNFKKEPTELRREQIREMVEMRIQERAKEDDAEAKTFQKFHSEDSEANDEVFPKPFQEVNRRPRLVGLNGSKLREMYADDIIKELKGYVKPVAENHISYREALRKIAVMIYKKDGGLMTKRCLSEYLRTQEFGTGPQKELFLEKYKAE